MSSITQPNQKQEDRSLDQALRPKKWSDYIGQEAVKKNLKILIQAALERNEPVEHLLFYGPPGTGKTSLALLIAKEMNCQIKTTSGPAIEKVGDLAAILTNLSAKDILFIDEAHRLNKLIEEILYPAMESRNLDIIIGKGPSARIFQLQLPPFTLIAATTRASLLSGPLRSRFSGGAFRLEFYSQEEINQILTNSSKILNIEAEAAALEEIAKRSRFTPRVANRLLKRCRDYAQVYQQKIDKETTLAALKLLELDELGLEKTDRTILSAIITKFNGGPVGIQTLAAAVTEDERTIEELYEPYLMRLGFLARTPRGRTATKRAYEHLKIIQPSQSSLI
ncbi:MAG: Holliday junction branch migration DNA helicase RuvB [Patescibacteria group bacterium]